MTKPTRAWSHLDDAEYDRRVIALTTAANNGHAESATTLGYLAKVAGDEQAAMSWWQRACSFGSSLLAKRTATLDLLTLLANDEEPVIRAVAANHPATPISLIYLLASQQVDEIRQAIASNPNAPPALLREIARIDKGDFPWGPDLRTDLRSLIAENPSAPIDLLKTLTQDRDKFRRGSVGLNPATPLALLEALAKSEGQERIDVASNPSLPYEFLKELSQDFDDDVLFAIASNPITPNSILDCLGRNDNLEVRTAVHGNVNATDATKVQAALLGIKNETISHHHNFGIDLQRELGPWIAAGLPKPDFKLLSVHVNPLIRLRVALNKRTPEAILHNLASDPSSFVREVAEAELETRAAASGNDERQDLEPDSLGSFGLSIGSQGPGGGVVFFDAGETKWWGRYLEAAREGWHLLEDTPPGSPDPTGVWGQMTGRDLGTRSGLGWGLWNTWHVIQADGKSSASGLAASYRGGNCGDWYLPSLGEIAHLAKNHDLIGRFAEDNYWSSTQREIDSQDIDLYDAWHAGIKKDAPSGVDHMHNELHIRPIRAF